MLRPKASHLVERVAEKLLRTGALEDSAAQVLDPDRPQAEFDAVAPAASILPETANPIVVAPVVEPQPTPAPARRRSGRSALFAPRPDAGSSVAAASIKPLPVVPRTVAAADDSPPSSVVQPRPRRAPQPEPTVRPMAPSVIVRDPTQAENSNNPDLLQGRSAIDAVALERGGMVDWSRTRSRISEEFRLVQRQILRTAFGPGSDPGFSNLLMVTSARPGEGKSFTSVNLAGSIARQGDHHVLLVDADSKRDSFCYSLGLAESRGLLDLVANPKLDPAPLIVKTPIERLSILPVGRERERSAELFSTKEMTRLIQSLGRRYADRLLILDAPPCLSTSDPAVLAPVVGQIVFVVEADRTQRDEVEASLDLIQACPTITMVLNKQQISSRYTFGAYSSYYSS